MSRALGGKVSTRRAPTWISPLPTCSRPASMRSKVDLPQPEGPSSTRNSRSATSNVILAATFFPPKLLLTPRSEMAAMMGVSATRSGLDATGRHAGDDIALHAKVEDDGGQRVYQPDGHHGMPGGV